jgi:glutamate N-acetyltransferase/amino-acid N-acetyltransferase
VQEQLIDIYFGGLIAAKGGLTAKTPVTELEKVVKEREFSVTIDLNLGSAEYKLYTTDLSEAYVDFNSSEYSAAIHAKRQKGLQ